MSDDGRFIRADIDVSIEHPGLQIDIQRVLHEWGIRAGIDAGGICQQSI